MAISQRHSRIWVARNVLKVRRRSTALVCTTPAGPPALFRGFAEHFADRVQALATVLCDRHEELLPHVVVPKLLRNVANDGLGLRGGLLPRQEPLVEAVGHLWVQPASPGEMILDLIGWKA